MTYAIHFLTWAIVFKLVTKLRKRLKESPYLKMKQNSELAYMR